MIWLSLCVSSTLYIGSSVVRSLMSAYLSIADLIAAGTDTISVTMSWNYAILCRYPDLQRRVSAEIDAFIKTHGRIPHFNEREEIPLCISVMKECMRYRPTSSFGVSHTTDKDSKYTVSMSA